MIDVRFNNIDGREIQINFDKDGKLQDLFKQYSKLANNIDIKSVLFYYETSNITDSSKTLNELLNDFNKEDNMVNIMVVNNPEFDKNIDDNDIVTNFIEPDFTNIDIDDKNSKTKKSNKNEKKLNTEKIINKINNIDINLIGNDEENDNDNSNLIIRENSFIREEKKLKLYLIKIYLILSIQFCLILVGSYLGFYFNFNKFFIEDTKSKLYTLIFTSIVIYIMCFSAIYITNKFENPSMLHLYHFLYVLCLILFIFLL